MNILILFSQPWKVGGAETHVEAMLSGFQHHNVYLSVNKGSNLERLKLIKEQYPKLKVMEIQSRGINIFRWLYDIYRLASLIKTSHINIISAQQRTSGVWAWLLQKMTKVPFVVTMHDSWHRAVFKKLYPKLFPIIIVVGSHLEKVLFEQFGFQKQQVSFVNNGIDINRFVSKDKLWAKQNLGIQPDDKMILHVSRLSSIKGAVALAIIDSLPLVLSKDPDVKLTIIGEGPLRSEIEKKAMLLNQQHGNIIEIKDFTNNLIMWYNAADMIIGEGRVAIESLACEKPVVAIRNSNNFFGLVTSDNIIEGVKVNFDGDKYQVNNINLTEEIVKALSVSSDECSTIAAYIRDHMSIDSMCVKYMKLFEEWTAKR
ncbi:Glycosyl transferase group 1 [uncultured Sporomusa sp.]|uniref:Glycosyl transferase group 1 n=1 Tax=uncultured Sporomusa sp. TaxID=307249 RepID=A0A212M1E1_9FIRM|nr:glycosyltransferase [uncultured Sporomusa sp.]SCM83611.1 Glycosyl transferase group 1 [uncultured Sporomusa sp.]